MKVPYFYADENVVEKMAGLILKHLLKTGAGKLSVWQPALVRFFERKSSPFYHIRKLNRHYIISKKFSADLNAHGEVDMQDGDADAAFT